MTMPDSAENRSCSHGCRTIVPPELSEDGLCLLHFMCSVEAACSQMRHESALGRAGSVRQGEIRSYIRVTATKLSRAVTGDVVLPDHLKKKALSTLLTLMILQESLGRYARRPLAQLTLRPSTAPVQCSLPGLERLRA